MVRSGVGYELPLTAVAVMSELPTPCDPMTAVFAFEKVGNSITEELYGGVAELGTILFAMPDGMRTVSVAGPLLAEPTEFETVTVNTAPLLLATVAGVV